jgi:hypothetical protein
MPVYPVALRFPAGHIRLSNTLRLRRAIWLTGICHFAFAGYPENMPVLRLQQPCFLSISRVGDELRISPWVLRELGAAVSI